MHPRVLAQRRAVATARLEEGITALAEQHGIEAPPAAVVRDPQVRDLHRMERLAAVIDVITGNASPEQASVVEEAGLRARLIDVRGVTEENVDVVLAELERDSDEPLQDRLTVIDGIGPRTAEAIEEEIG